MPAVLEILVTLIRVVSVPVRRVTGRCWQARAAEVAKLQVVVAGEGRPHVGRQPAARLQGDFEQDGERHPILAIGLEVPGVGRDVVLGLGRAAGDHHPGFRVDCA